MRLRVAMHARAVITAATPPTSATSAAVALFRAERAKRAVAVDAGPPSRRRKAPWPIESEAQIMETPGDYIVMRKPSAPLDLSEDPAVVRYREEKARRQARAVAR